MKLLTNKQLNTIKQTRILNRRRRNETITVQEHERHLTYQLDSSTLAVIKFRQIEILCKHADRCKITNEHRRLAKLAIRLLEDTFLQ